MTRRSTPLAPLQDGKDSPSALPAFVVDAVAGAVVAANAAGWRAWGLDPGRQRAAAAIDRAMPALQRLAARSGPGASETLTFWTPDGLLQLECRIEPVGAGSGRFLVHALRGGRRGAHASGEAVPAPGLTESDAARMSALARLAHEVRTPLSAAIAYAEVLKEEHFGPLADGRYREYARNIYESARHALSVIDGMLARDPDSAGLPELAFRDLDPAGVIDDCLAVARPLAERAGLDLIAHFGPRTPRVIADEVSLKQMLLNLITNAIKFARPGDRVTLGAAYGADGCLRIEVADTGPGMAAPTPLARGGAACAPEDQAGRPDAGLGIGLPLTRALAEANGAALIVDSAPGRGTRVTIAFGKDRVVPV
ncbi:MAG TPA: HAMP domain-containing sensor histidine kinase [Hyphomicrobiaceae bacterium]|jgi:signal transduction histidine kinase|nr:HAMP domain-containing sensor histidine kinase [Hyphomicrobiaceae bacterium]